MNAQEILEKSFAVVRDLDTFALQGNWVQFWRSATDPKINQTITKAFDLSYRKPNEIVVTVQDCDDQFKFVGSSTFIKGPNDDRARFFGGDAVSSAIAAVKLSNVPDELNTFIRYCLAPKERSPWYIKRNSFRLVQVKDLANKLILEGDLGTDGIVRLTVSSISYFIHSVEVTSRPVNTEFSREILATVVKTGEFFDTITGLYKNDKDKKEKSQVKPGEKFVLFMERELSFDRVSLNPKLTDADFLL